MSFGYAPRGWAQCNGQLLALNQNLALFSLLGTQFGGNGSTNFALPDLRGRVPVAFAPEYPIGQRAGEEQHTLTNAELAQHTHVFQASTQDANQAFPVGAVLAGSDRFYGPPANTTIVGQSAPYGPMIGATGATGPHENRMPYLTLNFCIALEGVFPSKN
jgi:microcystin-dependent protein